VSQTFIISLARMPCLFYRERSEECLFQRLIKKYGSGKTIKDAIALAIQSIVRGLREDHNKDFLLLEEDIQRIFTEICSFIKEGLEKSVSESPPCMGIFLTNKGYSCPVHSLNFDANKYEPILHLIGSPEDPGCLCYFSALVRSHGIVDRSTIKIAKEFLQKLKSK
jgi:hypothetical protein